MGTKIIYTDDLHVVGELYDSNNQPGETGKTLVATSTGSTWQEVPAGIPVLVTTAILNGIAVTNNQTFAAVNCIGSQILTSGSEGWTSSSSSIEIPATGYYQISFAISTTSTGARATDVFAITVNGTVQAEESNSAYIRNASGINEGACVLTIVKYFITGDDIGLASRREGTITTAGSTVSAKSVLSIQAIGRPATTSGVVSSAESSEATRNIVIGTSATPPDIGSVDTNTIYTGEGKNHQGLYRNVLFVSNEEIHWIREDLTLKIGETLKVEARIRYRQVLEKATLHKVASGLYVAFENKQSAIQEGQFVAWYKNEELLGSGVIS